MTECEGGTFRLRVLHNQVNLLAKRVMRRAIWNVGASANSENNKFSASISSTECLRGAKLHSSLFNKHRGMMNIPRVDIKGCTIELMSEKKKDVLSEVEISKPLHPDVSNTVVDPRMGMIKRCQECAYCKQVNCPGHYGSINLKSYIPDPKYIRAIIAVINSICQDCSRLKLDEETLEAKGILKAKGLVRLMLIEDLSEKNVHCTHENGGLIDRDERHPLNIYNPDTGELEPNCVVTTLPCGPNYPIDKSSAKKSGIIRSAKSSGNDGDEGSTPFSNVRIYSMLNCIPDRDAELMGFVNCHPRDLMLSTILVTPNTTRPYNVVDAKEVQGKLTLTYNSVVNVVSNSSAQLGATIDGNNIRKNASDNEIYTAIVTLYESGGGENTRAQNRTTSYKHILTRKEGMPRNNIQGKRGNFNGRTVAGPGPELELGYIGIPEEWTSNLAKFDIVHQYNYDWVQSLFRSGQLIQIRRQVTGMDQHARNGTSPPNIGDRVMRKLQDGDYLYSNRQPTLTQYSLIGARASISHGDPSHGGQERAVRTVRIPLEWTGPTNADFDGDDFNVHSNTTIMAENELRMLVSIRHKLLNITRAEPTMGAVMDSIVGCFIMSMGKKVVSQEAFIHYRNDLLAIDQMDSYEARCRDFNLDPLNCRAVISSILPQDFYYFRKSRYNDEAGTDPDLLIVNGIIVSGYLTKNDVGSSQGGIVHKIILEYGDERGYQLLTDIPRITGKFLLDHGFSVGMDDVSSVRVKGDGTLHNEIEEKMNSILEDMSKKLIRLGNPYEDERLKAYREGKIVEIVSGVNISALLASRKFFTLSQTNPNSVAVMINRGAGSKGTLDNMGQMITAVGQQFDEGTLYNYDIAEGTRSSPYSDPYDLRPSARGFVSRSLFHGVNPDELYFMQRSARVALARGQKETPRTGESQRQLAKTCEILIVDQDLAVRTCSGALVSPSFNGGMKTDRQVRVSGQYVPVNISHLTDKFNAQRGWLRNSQHKYVQESDVTSQKPITYVPRNLEVDFEKLTRFERTSLVGMRGHQISYGSPSTVETKNIHALDIALEEIKADRCPLRVQRVYPDGRKHVIVPSPSNFY